MDALLTVIVIWLSANFGLPGIDEHPRIEFVPASQITALRYQSLAVAPLGEGGGREVVSVYDDTTSTIYLRASWTGNTPAESSILVHEMVHHLQNIGNVKFECPEEREQLAYAAQEKWLGLFGRDLLSDFEIDPFTLFVSTRCIY